VETKTAYDHSMGDETGAGRNRDDERYVLGCYRYIAWLPLWGDG
jgi:hypothetical protein